MREVFIGGIFFFLDLIFLGWVDMLVKILLFFILLFMICCWCVVGVVGVGMFWDSDVLVVVFMMCGVLEGVFGDGFEVCLISCCLLFFLLLFDLFGLLKVLVRVELICWLWFGDDVWEWKEGGGEFGVVCKDWGLIGDIELLLFWVLIYDEGYVNRKLWMILK